MSTLGNIPRQSTATSRLSGISDDNPHYTPAFLLKEATVLREQKDFKAEAAVYEEIMKDYPNYGAEIGVDLEKYLERAQDAAAK